jgi:hypothetical protein
MTGNDLQIPATRVLAVASHVVSGYVGNKIAVFVLQSLGCDVAALNTVQFSTSHPLCADIPRPPPSSVPFLLSRQRALDNNIQHSMGTNDMGTSGMQPAGQRFPMD